MLKTLYIIFLINSVVFYAQTTTVQGTVKDKDFPSYNLDSAYVKGINLNTQIKEFEDYTDENGFYSGSITSTSVDDATNVPIKFTLSNNYPNPFNPTTKFEASISKSRDYTLEIFDVTGSKIISQDYNLSSGGYTFNVSGLGAAGVKFYRLTGEDFSETKKMIQMDGSTDNPTINMSGGASNFALSKVNNLDMRIFASKEGYKTDSIEVSYVPGSVNTQDFLLSQIPTLDTIHVFTDQTLIPTNTPADNASIIGKNGSSTLFSGLTNSNGEFSTDLIVEYVTNPNNVNEKIYKPNSITINSTRQNTLNDSETFTINGADLVWINDLEQTLINKNGTATGNVTDNILVPINNASVKLYNNDNNSLLGQTNTNTSGNYTLNYNYTGYENDISDLFTPIDSMKFDFSAANHNPKTIIKNFKNPTLTNAVLDKNAFEFNATLNLYKTLKGQTVTDLDSVFVQWPDGSTNGYANNNGVVVINKQLYSLNSDTTAELSHKHPESYLKWMIGHKINADRPDWIFQNENSTTTSTMPLNVVNQEGTVETYLVPKFANYGPNNNTQIDMESATVKNFYNRNGAYVSGFRPSPAGYDTTDIVQLLYNETTNEPMPQNELDRANNEIQKFLTAVDSWSLKKLLNYRFTQIESSTDPFFLYLINPNGRNRENFSQSNFYNGGPLNVVNISSDGTLRIKNSYSKYSTAETNGNIQNEFFDSMLNTRTDNANYIMALNISGAPYTDLAQNLIGISHVFKPGTQYLQP